MRNRRKSAMCEGNNAKKLKEVSFSHELYYNSSSCVILYGIGMKYYIQTQHLYLPYTATRFSSTNNHQALLYKNSKNISTHAVRSH